MTIRLSAADIEIERDINYGKGGDTPLLLDIYRPKGPPKELFPAVIMVHGGGWRDCDKMTVPLPPRNLAARGYFVASIDYRLSGKACFPAAVEDCKCAVRWMRAHAGTYGVDPDRIGVVGASAGGHLVLMLGCADEKAGFEGTGGHANVSSRVQAVCDFCGPTDLLTQELKPPLLKEVEQDFIGATIDQKPDVYKKASPIEYVSKENPPTLIIHGDQDDIVPYEQSVIMYKKMRAAEIDVTLVRVKNGIHGNLTALEKSDSGSLIEPGNKEIATSALSQLIFEFFDRTLK